MQSTAHMCLCTYAQGFRWNTDDGKNLGKCADADCPCEAFDEDVLYHARPRAELAAGTSAKRDEATRRWPRGPLGLTAAPLNEVSEDDAPGGSLCNATNNHMIGYEIRRDSPRLAHTGCLPESPYCTPRTSRKMTVDLAGVLA